MKVLINKTIYKDFNFYEENKLNARSYFIPYATKEKCLKTEVIKQRYNSETVVLLSGEWGFKYFDNINNVDDVIDTESIGFDKIVVPSCWSRLGYEPPFYVNTRYQFACNPPNIPDVVPIGVYSKKITLKTLAKNNIITFLGVSNAFALYVNGKYVGYAECSHNTSEFDLNSFLQKGENEIAVVVYKWCNGTYLECQDMFREHGIFRDVYLQTLGDVFVEDFKIDSVKTEIGYDMTVNLSLNKACANAKIKVEIFSASAEKPIASSSVACGEGKCSANFINLKVEEWNAEIPTVYNVLITLIIDEKEVEFVSNITGFKYIEIEETVFKFNGKKIKLKGVNHHDTNAKTGFTMSAEDLLKDVTTMKQYNVNAVRTSHYPPDPIFLQLCDIYGLYVIDEADIETHGCECGELHNANLISDNPVWRTHYWERVRGMFERDKNHPCITMWSLGNEAGGIANQDYCYENLKMLDLKTPVHYEAACRSARKKYDVMSEMYTSHMKMSMIANKLIRGFNDAPYFLCEYAHAMGVGPGSLEDYWKLIYAHDIFLGGCIWEFADHAVYHAETDSFTYGGDHGEFIHDGNFCVDGLFRPFRNPSSGALNMKNVYRPIRANHISGNSYEFVNTNRFKNADYLTIVWKLQKAGEVVEQNKITLDIPPCKHKTISIMHANIDEINEYQILFEYYDKDMLVGFEQIILAHKIFNMVDVAGDISIVKSGNLLKVNPSDNVNIIFDKKSGFLTDYVINGVSLLNQTPSQYLGIMPVLYRAPLDNDMNIKKSWTKLNYDKANFTKNYFSYKYKKGIVTVKAVYAFNAKFGGQFMDVKYQIDDNGVITVTVKYSNLLFGMPPLAKVGLSFEMPKEFDQIEYYGLGDSESLPDFTAHTYLGLFKTDVAKMKEWYIKPQDSGYRCDVRYAKITNGKKLGLQIFNQNAPFIFNARHNTMQDLLKAKHHNELTDSPTTLINIDGFIRGTGSNSCGPAPLAKYCLNKRRYDYAFKIVPIYEKNN